MQHFPYALWNSMKIGKLCTHAFTNTSTHRAHRHSLWRMHTQIQTPSVCLVLLFHISKLNPQHVSLFTSYSNRHTHTNTSALTHSCPHPFTSTCVHTMFYKIVWTPTALTTSRLETRRQKGENLLNWTLLYVAFI